MGKKRCRAGNISELPASLIYREGRLRPAETSCRSQECHVKVKWSLENRDRMRVSAGQEKQRWEGFKDGRLRGVGQQTINRNRRRRGSNEGSEK